MSAALSIRTALRPSCSVEIFMELSVWPSFDGHIGRLNAMIVLLPLCGSLSAATFAQTACPQGVMPGSSQCLPSLRGGSPAAQEPALRWKLTWGAIALDDNTVSIGTATGQASRRAALKEATRKCESIGGKECRIILYYENQCAAIAEPVADITPMIASYKVGLSSQEAVDKAIQECETKNSAGKCKAIYSNCTTPVRVG